eukprot:scaffold43479_cov24-Prasinocladus_malaysianus.AAC.2
MACRSMLQLERTRETTQAIAIHKITSDGGRWRPLANDMMVAANCRTQLRVVWEFRQTARDAKHPHVNSDIER